MFDVKNIVLPYKFMKYLGFLEAYGLKFGKLVNNNAAEKVPYLVLFIIASLFAWNTQKIMTRFKPYIICVIIIFVIAAVSMMNFSGISDFLYFQF